jgi:hypothetical protein
MSHTLAALAAPEQDRRDRTAEGILRRCPRIVAHVIAESLGYATPTLAAKIVADAADGRENWCEWIAACYGGDPRAPVSDAIRRRHTHHGYIALALVRRWAATGEQPLLGSWF